MRFFQTLAVLAIVGSMAFMAPENAKADRPGQQGVQDALTVWWVIFNNPGECADGPGLCTEGDLFNSDVDACVLHAAGAPTTGDGPNSFTISASLGQSPAEGTADCLLNVLGFFANDAGLQDPQNAEIHLIVRTHGEILEGSDLVEQISTFLGNCGAPFDPSDICQDLQFAVHPGAVGGAPTESNLYWFDNAGALASGLGIPAALADQLAGSQIDGAVSTLTRTNDAVTMTIQTSIAPVP